LRSIPVTLHDLDPDEQEEAMNRKDLEAAKAAGTVLAAQHGGHESSRDEMGKKRCIPVVVAEIETRRAGYGGSTKTVAYVRPVLDRLHDLDNTLSEGDRPNTVIVTEDGLLGRRVWERDIPEEEQAIVATTREGRSILAPWEAYVAARHRFIGERNERNRKRDEKRARNARAFDNLERALAGSGITFSRIDHSGTASFEHEQVGKLAAYVAELRGAAVEA
jgi:hypothetical protein